MICFFFITCFWNAARKQLWAFAALLHVNKLKAVTTWGKAQVHFEFLTVAKGVTDFSIFAPVFLLEVLRPVVYAIIPHIHCRLWFQRTNDLLWRCILILLCWAKVSSPLRKSALNSVRRTWRGRKYMFLELVLLGNYGHQRVSLQHTIGSIILYQYWELHFK